MPDKKRKFETKVHRKTLNPFFNETFAFKNVRLTVLFLFLFFDNIMRLHQFKVGPLVPDDSLLRIAQANFFHK